MDWIIDDHARLVITVTPEQQALLREQRDELGFDSDGFMHDLLEPLITNDEYFWLPDGCTSDLTSAPMLGVLGDTRPGPEDYTEVGTGLVHVGCWEHDGQLRQMYQPVLSRWAFMSYQVTSPQRELAEYGKCVWEGGAYE